MKETYDQVKKELNEKIVKFDKTNIKLEEIFSKLIEFPITNNFVYYILSLLKLINNKEIKNYDIENIQSLYDYFIKNYNIKNKMNDFFNEIESIDFIKLSFNNLYNKLFFEYIYNELSSSKNNIQFKITPPQLIDANATTGVSIKLKNINIVSETDKNSTTCNYFLSIFFKIIQDNNIKINDILIYDKLQNTLDTFKELFNNNLKEINDIFNKLNKDKNSKELNDILKEYNKKNFIQDFQFSLQNSYGDYLKKIKEIFTKFSTYNKYLKKNLKDRYYNIILDIFNNLEKINTEYLNNLNKDNLNKDNYDKIFNYLISTCENQIYYISSLLNSISEFKKSNNCFDFINILNDNLSTKYEIQNNVIYHITDNVVFEEPVNIEVMSVSFNNNNYIIDNIQVLKIENTEVDDIEFIKNNMNAILIKNNILNIIALKILKDCNINFEEIENNTKDIDEQNSLKNVFEKIKNVSDFKNINSMSLYENNIILNLLDIKINNNKILHTPIEDKNFYYCSLNKTLYSAENGSPGVEDLLKIHEYLSLNIKNDKINLYKNIFAIKRSGDYLQIDYCKKNNYIFVTVDAMSAAFCFIDNCEFIGPFGPYGLFIKKQENSNKYCYTDDKYNLIYNE